MPQVEIAVIVMKDAVNVLLVKPQTGQDSGKWSLPKGPVNEGEKLIEACERLLKEQCGLPTNPKKILFPMEIVEPEYHHVILVGFSECPFSSGEPTVSEALVSAKFVDPRSLVEYQENMTSWTIQAFANFSLILMQQAQAGG